jgi:hypothetical protein
MKKLLRFSLLLIPFIFSCEGKRETLPSYITINDVNFQYDNVSVVGNGGTAITDVWVYDNADLLGVFELPATIAVATEGVHEITVAGGIKLNGISATREAYAFYQRWNSTVDLKPLDTAILEPTVSYYLQTGISFIEEFEDVVLKLDTAPSSDVALVRTLIANQPPYLDRYVGKVTLTAADPGFKAFNKELFMVPTSSQLPIYLEMDYKCNQEFVISSVVQEPGQGVSEIPVISLRSTVVDGEMVWKHIYIDLTDAFIGQATATGFGFGITAYYSSGNSEGLIYIDNTKVVNTK